MGPVRGVRSPLFILCILILWAALLGTPLYSSGITGEEVAVDQLGRPYKKGEVIVRFKGAPQVPEGLKGISVRRLAGDIYLVRGGGEVVTVQGLADALKGEVLYAEPNYLRRVQAVPNDPLFTEQWAMEFISAPSAWDLTRCQREVVVAVIDTGIQMDHPELAENIWRNPAEVADGLDNDQNGYIDDTVGWDFVNRDNSPQDDHGHGTHVAGLIGAAGNNGLGIAGVCWQVSLMPLKVLDAEGWGTVADEIEAIGYAVEEGADVINASFGGYSFINAERDAIEMARSEGVVVITAAGNGGKDGIGDDIDITPFYPASYGLDNIIAVTAVDHSGMLPVFANHGATTVDIGSPGVYLLSTVPYNSYSLGIGTSMATAVVTGVYAMVKGYYQGLNYLQVKELMKRGVNQYSGLQGRVSSGGVVDAWGAVSALLPPTSLVVEAVTTDTVQISWSERATLEDGYTVERDSGEGFQVLTTLPADATSFTDTGLLDGRGYSYRLRAYLDGVAEGPYSGTLHVVTPLAPPTALTGSATTTEVVLQWVDNSSSEESYILERGLPGGEYTTLATLPPDTTVYTDTAVSGGTTYSYRLMAYNSVAGYSEAVEVLVTVPSVGAVSGGGGGGCSVRGGGDPSDLLPLIAGVSLFWYLRRRRPPSQGLP